MRACGTGIGRGWKRPVKTRRIRFQASSSQPGSHLASKTWQLACRRTAGARVRVDAADGVRCFRALAWPCKSGCMRRFDNVLGRRPRAHSSTTECVRHLCSAKRRHGCGEFGKDPHPYRKGTLFEPTTPSYERRCSPAEPARWPSHGGCSAPSPAEAESTVCGLQRISPPMCGAGR